MANNLKDHLKEVADAIRAKKGTSDLINPQDFATEIEGISGSGGESGSSETLYFAAKDGGAMGNISEMALMGGFAVKKADNTISALGYLLTRGDFSVETLLSIKAMACALGDYSSDNQGADLRNPDTLRGMMFQLNGMEGMPEIIEITKEQFYDLNA